MRYLRDFIFVETDALSGVCTGSDTAGEEEEGEEEGTRARTLEA